MSFIITSMDAVTVLSDDSPLENKNLYVAALNIQYMMIGEKDVTLSNLVKTHSLECHTQFKTYQMNRDEPSIEHGIIM